jgi:hypothetical protein
MAKACALTTVGVLGLWAALDPPFTHADPTGHGVRPVTVTRTVTRDRRIEGWNVSTWRAHAVRNRRRINRLGRRLDELRRALRAPRGSVREALALARVVYGVDQTHRAYCESRLDPYATEGHGPVGLLQFQPSTWGSTPFGGLSIWSPYAQALAGGWMVRHGRSGEWSCGL